MKKIALIHTVRPGYVRFGDEIKAALPGVTVTNTLDEELAREAGAVRLRDCLAHALALPGGALDASRAVLAANGNMSSATLMFVLARMLAGPPIRDGVALAFGPGLAAEGFAFRSA